MAIRITQSVSRKTFTFRLQSIGRRRPCVRPIRSHPVDGQKDQSALVREADPDPAYLEHLEGDKIWFNSNKEFKVFKRVADQLFPEGQMDWEEFWSRDDYEEWYDEWRELLEAEGGLDEDLQQYEESEEGQRIWLIKAVQYLKTRPDYEKKLPYDFAKDTMEPESPEALPVRRKLVRLVSAGTVVCQEFDPDWDDWDWRAAMEKRRAREKERRAWRKWQEEWVGKYQYVNLVDVDMRLSERQRAAYRWTEKEIWDIISQKGKGFDPRTAKGPWKEKGPWIELNPTEVPDWAALGNVPVPEIDEWMRQNNLMVDDKEFFDRDNERLEQESKSQLDDSNF